MATQQRDTQLREKYKPVIQLVKDYALRGGEIWEENQMLHIRATVQTSLERNTIRERIKEISGATPPDLEASIEIEKFEELDVSNPKTATSKVAHRYKKPA